jgi:hypothetical protein
MCIWQQKQGRISHINGSPNSLICWFLNKLCETQNEYEERADESQNYVHLSSEGVALESVVYERERRPEYQQLHA